MRFLVAFIGMSMLMLAGVVFAAAQTLIRSLPMLVAVLAVLGVLWLRDKLRGPAPGSAIVPAPQYTARPVSPPRPAGSWVMVPVWMPPNNPPQHPFIDGDVIDDGGRYG
jgi:hypothetical protein